MNDDVQKLLRELGVGTTYMGCRAVVIFVEIVSEDEDRLLNIVDTYKEVALRMGTTWRAVERNIRTVINRAWSKNPKQVIKIVGYPMDFQPTVSEFLEGVYNYTVRLYVK